MKYLKMIGLAALSAMALMAFTAGSASANTTALEVGGVTKNEAVTINASIAAGTSATLKTTSESQVTKCANSTVHGDTVAPFTATTVGGPIETLTFTNCDHSVVVHKAGSLSIERIGNTTNGTVSSAGAEVTVQSTTFGTNLNCTTGAGRTIGTLTGTGDTTKHAVMHINAVLNCGFFVPSAKWEGTYTVTSPTGLGVTA